MFTQVRGGARLGTVKGWVVARELLSPQVVIAQCQVLRVVAKWPGIGGVCWLGSGPETLY